MFISSAIRRATSSAVRTLPRSVVRNRLNRSPAASLLRRGATDGLSVPKAVIGSRTDLCFFSPQRSYFSSLAAKPASDAELVKVIESEIQCAEECDDHDRVEEIPEGFPFKIQDDKGMNTITLRRKYQGEDVEVTVAMPSLVTGEEPDRRAEGDDDEEGGGEESSSQSSIPLTVVVNRGKGLSLEFTCTAYPDEITIDAMSVREDASKAEQELLPYEGPDFNDLDENLQKAFHKYLELRGITPLTTNFLHEYMINKDSREYLHWLNNLKEFVEK